MSEPLFLSNEGVVWDTIEDDWERFEFASYIVNTPADQRKEISPEDATAALAWLEAQA